MYSCQSLIPLPKTGHSATNCPSNQPCCCWREKAEDATTTTTATTTAVAVELTLSDIFLSINCLNSWCLDYYDQANKLYTGREGASCHWNFGYFIIAKLTWNMKILTIVFSIPSAYNSVFSDSYNLAKKIGFSLIIEIRNLYLFKNMYLG